MTYKYIEIRYMSKYIYIYNIIQCTHDSSCKLVPMASQGPRVVTVISGGDCLGVEGRLAMRENMGLAMGPRWTMAYYDFI